MNSIMWIFLAFVLYIIMMAVIGIIYVKKTKNTADYFLGGRGLSGMVAALSAQASDMSGWLLMGLPGSLYAVGTGQIWIAVGLFIGTVFNWMFISGRLRRYSIRANDSLTLPQYLQNRFHDKSKVLLGASSIVIVIFFLVYTASAFASGGKLFSTVFGIDYKTALTIGAIVIIFYTFLGGFMAVSMTDFIQGMLMLIAVLTIPTVAYLLMGNENFHSLLNASLGGDKTLATNYLNIMKNGNANVSFTSIISQFGWGLGYMGMPHILIRFMAVKNETELKKSRVIAIVWVAMSLAFACIIGIVGRAFLFTDYGILQDPENVFIIMIQKIFTEYIPLPFVGGIFLSASLAAIMSTADSQLLVAASSFAEDIYKGVLCKKKDEKGELLISKVAVLVIAIIAYVIALDPNSSVMALVSDAWAGLGAAFGPVILLSLYWKRMNLQGAAAGIISGALVVIVWDYMPLIKGAEGMLTLSKQTGLYSLVVGFFVSIVLIFVVSLLTKEPEQVIYDEWQDVMDKSKEY